ncbi:MAG: helix-turn-helix domain-containing protein [Candidatus Saccharimonadales bacterium]
MKMDKELLNLLTSLELNRNEALTYAALLQIDSVSIRKIAAVTGVNRGTTYEALKHLVTLGLASVKSRGEREYYTAESPEKIHDLIRDKRRDLLDASTTAKSLIPRLLSKHAQPEGRPVVRYYEGDDGVVTILKDVLQTCRDLDDSFYYAYSTSKIRQYLYRKFPQFTDRRIAEGIAVKVIAVGEGGEMTTGAERKWLLSEASPTNATSYTIIYGDKVAIISTSSDLTPYGVVVEDGGAASMQRMIFEQLWKHL